MNENAAASQTKRSLIHTFNNELFRINLLAEALQKTIGAKHHPEAEIATLAARLKTAVSDAARSVKIMERDSNQTQDRFPN